MSGKRQETKRSILKDAFGFVDRFIGTRAHDEHLHWLEKNFEKVVALVYPEMQWDPDVVAKGEALAQQRMEVLRKWISQATGVSDEVKQPILNWEGLGPPPHRNWKVHEPILQSPIYSVGVSLNPGRRPGKILGYFDLEVKIEFETDLECMCFGDSQGVSSMAALNYGLDSGEVPRWDTRRGRHSLLFMVESETEGYGQLIQRVRAYEEYTGSCDFVIVSPDDTYAESFQRQSIRFVKCPLAKG